MPMLLQQSIMLSSGTLKDGNVDNKKAQNHFEHVLLESITNFKKHFLNTS